MSNHSPIFDDEMRKHQDEMMKEFLQKSKPLIEQLGATGNFPNGKLTKNDEGEIRIAIGTKDNCVVMDFGNPTAWIGFQPDQAREIGRLLIQKANGISPCKHEWEPHYLGQICKKCGDLIGDPD